MFLSDQLNSQQRKGHVNLIFCIRIVGTILNSALQKALFAGAEKLLKENQKKRILIRGEGFEGEVRTDRKIGRLRGIYGTIFHATIEADNKVTRVDYTIYSPFDPCLAQERPRDLASN